LRCGERAEVIVESRPRPPRRLGHVVVGTPEVEKTKRLFVDGLGFRVSDVVAGMAFFTRCSPDHHNLLIQPGPVPYLNHYALELDDIDAVARAASLYTRAHPDAHVDGLGRHTIGGNVFWYMRDPSGTFFEYFTDMDAIDDDDAWRVRGDWSLEDSWSVWGSKDAPEVLFQPGDIEEVIAGYRKENG
jgi:catechol-2,3-dioxygenase